MTTGTFIKRLQNGQIMVRLSDSSIAIAAWQSNSDPSGALSLTRSASGSYIAKAKNALVGLEKAKDLVIGNSEDAAISRSGEAYDVDYSRGDIFNKEAQSKLNVLIELKPVLGAVWLLDEEVVEDTFLLLRTGEFSLKLAFEDSANCGGFNSQIQRGLAILTVRSKRLLELNIKAKGNIEIKNTGFDRTKVYKLPTYFEMPDAIGDEDFTVQDGELLLDRASVGQDVPCAMELVEADLNNIEFTQADSLLLWASTVDAAHHIGAYWSFDFDITVL